MADGPNNLERNPRLEYLRADSVIPINPSRFEELVLNMQWWMQLHMVQLVQNNNELLHQLLQINDNNNNNQLHAGYVVPNGNVQILQLDPDRPNPEDGIDKLLALYVGAQGAIFNAAFFEEGRTGCEILWSRFILSGLVSFATIVYALQIFFQQFIGVRPENYWRWVAQKAAFIGMLIAFSVCLLLSCTSVLCISRH